MFSNNTRQFLLSWASNECKHDSLYVSKATPANKIHTQRCKRNASKVKVQTTKPHNNFNIALVFIFISYKVIPFLVFVLAKILFFRREETYIFWTQPAITCSKWTTNTEWLKKLQNMFKVNSKDTRMKPIEVAAVSFGVN